MRRSALCLATLTLVATTLYCSTATADPQETWSGTWSAAPQPPASGAAGISGRTLRETVRTSAGGDRIRVRITNVFGTAPLVLDSVTVALHATGAATVPGSVRTVTFSGHPGAVLPAGTETWSDPVALGAAAGQELTVSLYASGTTPAPTVHNLTETANYSAPGDHTADTGPAAFTTTSSPWTFLDGVDVLRQCPADSVVALGDSITDGVHSSAGGWPTDLARRLDARPGCRPGVLNEGINANRLLTDNTPVPDTGQARWQRDVLGQTGVRTVILLEGINDIGHDLSATGGPVTARDVIDAYQALIRSAHGQGLRVIGGTLPPIGGSKYDTPAAQAVRGAVNTWIRTAGAFDGVVDFDRAVRDPADPARLRAAYDSGDHLHPDDAGYQAMADAIDLRMIHR